MNTTRFITRKTSTPKFTTLKFFQNRPSHRFNKNSSVRQYSRKPVKKTYDSAEKKENMWLFTMSYFHAHGFPKDLDTIQPYSKTWTYDVVEQQWLDEMSQKHAYGF